VKRHENVSFHICVFLKFFLPTPYSQEDIQYIRTNLHTICLWLNSIQSWSHYWIEIEFRFNPIEFKYIEWISISYMNEFVFFTSTKFIIFSCSTMYLLFLWFSILLISVQIIGKIYCMLHITSYHHYSLVEIHLYQAYFKLSCHVIDIWTCVVQLNFM